MTKICFLDTETTSLRHDRRAWEIGLIVRDDTKRRDEEFRWFIDSSDLDLGNADLMSLKIGKFYERHPYLGDKREPETRDVRMEWDALTEVETLTRGAHIVGAVPNFDTEVLGNRMRANGICPSWHYHLIDIEALMVGYLAAKGRTSPLPWRSDDLAAAVGVTVREEDRHTALGDARMARAVYDAVFTNAVGAEETE